MPDVRESRRAMLQTALIFEGGLVVLALVLGWLVGQPLLEQIHWTGRGLLLGLAATVPPVAALVLMDRYPLGPVKRLGELVRQLIVPLFRDCKPWDLLAIAALAGLGEELLFRGVLQTGLADWWGSPWPAIVVASLAFGLAHPITPTYAVLAAGIGVYLGWLLVACDNLLVPIVAHAAYDFAALVYLLRATPIESLPDEPAAPPADEWSF